MELERGCQCQDLNEQPFWRWVRLGIVTTKRVYEPFSHKDGFRVLVDRLWPRGIAKDDPRIDWWLREVAPTDDVRRRFHRTGDFSSFVRDYRMELNERAEARDAFRQLCELVKVKDRLTLVYASKDEQRNNAVVLKQLLEVSL